MRKSLSNPGYDDGYHSGRWGKERTIAGVLAKESTDYRRGYKEGYKKGRAARRRHLNWILDTTPQTPKR